MAYNIDGVVRVTRLYYGDKVRGLRGTEEQIMRFGDVSWAVIGIDPDNDEVMLLGDPNQILDDQNPLGVESNCLTKIEVGPPMDYNPLADKIDGHPDSNQKQYAGPVHFKHLNI